MRHPTDGTLRRLVDEPAGVADADREHVSACPECLAGLAVAQQDAALVGSALAMDVPTDVDAAWHRLSAASLRGERAAATPAPGRWRARLRSPAIAAVCVAAIVGGAGVAAAANWLPIFRTEKIAPVLVGADDIVRLPDLAAYGDITVLQEPFVRRVDSAAAAEKATALTVPRVGELPRGVTGGPEYHAGGPASAVFTFSAAKAAKAAAAAGEALPPPPAGLDGSRFRLVAGPGIAAVWSEARGIPALVVARAVAPTAYSSGISFATARDYLLSLPGMPDDVAKQLRSFSGDGRTLPLLLPADLVTTSTADVGGVPATVLRSRDGTMAGVVWVKDGVVTAVGGSLSTDEVLAVARGLR